MLDFLKFWRCFGEKEDPAESKASIWNQLVNTYLIDGTFVEYARQGQYREVELTRDRIKEVRIGKGLVLTIIGENEGYFSFNSKNSSIERVGRRYDIDCDIAATTSYHFSLAPPGEVIPQKPSLEDISQENGRC